MIKIIFLLIVILQLSSCVKPSRIGISNSQIQDRNQNGFATPPGMPKFVRDEHGPSFDGTSGSRAFYLDSKMWPQLTQDEISNFSPYQRRPISIFPTMRRKRPDKFGRLTPMERLMYRVTNYEKDQEQREMSVGENKKRTHLFGYPPNYKGRN